MLWGCWCVRSADLQELDVPYDQGQPINLATILAPLILCKWQSDQNVAPRLLSFPNLKRVALRKIGTTTSLLLRICIFHPHGSQSKIQPTQVASCKFYIGRTEEEEKKKWTKVSTWESFWLQVRMIFEVVLGRVKETLNYFATCRLAG